MLNTAVKVLDGEKKYNQNNLDQYLMGIQKLRVEKKNFPKLPAIKILSKADETFYQQYSTKNN